MLGLPDLDESMDEDYGLLCKARCGTEMVLLSLGELETRRAKPNRQLLTADAYWLWNCR